MFNFDKITQSEGWRYGKHKISISKNDELNDITVEVDPPDISMSDCIKYLLAVRMKHNKMVFNGTTIHHVSIKRVLRNPKIKAHYKEIMLLNKSH